MSAEDADAELQRAIALSMQPPAPPDAASSTAPPRPPDDDPIVEVLRAAEAARREGAAKPCALLQKYLRNVVESPDDARFRSLKLANKACAQVWADPPCRAVLSALCATPPPRSDAGDADATLELDRARCDAAASLALDELVYAEEPLGDDGGGGGGGARGAGARGRGGEHCMLCGRGVGKYSWAPRGGFVRRARAPWEGMRCDTCGEAGAAPFLACGECYNLGATSARHAPGHVFSALGYGPDDEGGAGRMRRGRPAPPPPSSNRRGAFG